VQPGYLSVLRLAMSKPNTEDKPGEITGHARRAQAGLKVEADQVASGF
jgi:hypothetical protein